MVIVKWKVFLKEINKTLKSKTKCFSKKKSRERMQRQTYMVKVKLDLLKSSRPYVSTSHKRNCLFITFYFAYRPCPTTQKLSEIFYIYNSR
jgi:hypothetical protein